MLSFMRVEILVCMMAVMGVVCLGACFLSAIEVDCLGVLIYCGRVLGWGFCGGSGSQEFWTGG